MNDTTNSLRPETKLIIQEAPPSGFIADNSRPEIKVLFAKLVGLSNNAYSGRSINNATSLGGQLDATYTDSLYA